MMFWLIFLAVLVSMALLASRFCYVLVFYNRNDREDDPYSVPPGDQYAAVADKMRGLIKAVDEVPFENVYLIASDGVRLVGRYYHFADGAPLQLQFHGYRGNGIREFCGGWKLAKAMGFNSLVVDQRAHGKSEGHTISFGIRERFDCQQWAWYAAERFGEDVPIILSGISMGAATVLMASELELPSNIAAIMADCPYSSPGAVIRKVCRDTKIPDWLAYPFVTVGGLLFGGFRIWESSAVNAVKHTKIPIHLTHGEDDRFVPVEMSFEIRDHCAGPVKLLTIPGAGHGLSYLVDPDAYERSVKQFLADCSIV